MYVSERSYEKIAKPDLRKLLAFSNQDREEFFKTGERIFNLKRLYNNRLGITRKDDVLPIRMMRHKRGGGTNILPPLNEMLDEYYTYRGWDELGRPTRTKLKELELESFIL